MSGFNNLIIQIKSCLITQDRENGYAHPVEPVLKKLIENYEIDFIKYMMLSITDEQDFIFLADLLMCLGYFSNLDWVDMIYQKSLSHSCVTVRDAAVQMLEAHNRIDIIKKYNNEEVPWLKSYIESIIRHSENKTI